MQNADVFLIHDKIIRKFKIQQKWWMVTSFVLCISSMIVAIFWDDVHNSKHYTRILCIIVIIVGMWWYWTMQYMRSILDHQSIELLILKDIIEEVQEVKVEVRKLQPTNVEQLELV